MKSIAQTVASEASETGASRAPLLPSFNFRPAEGIPGLWNLPGYPELTSAQLSSVMFGGALKIWQDGQGDISITVVEPDELYAKPPSE